VTKGERRSERTPFGDRHRGIARVELIPKAERPIRHREDVRSSACECGRCDHREQNHKPAAAHATRHIGAVHGEASGPAASGSERGLASPVARLPLAKACFPAEDLRVHVASMSPCSAKVLLAPRRMRDPRSSRRVPAEVRSRVSSRSHSTPSPAVSLHRTRAMAGRSNPRGAPARWGPRGKSVSAGQKTG
jgi:hypothetical protein